MIRRHQYVLAAGAALLVSSSVAFGAGQNTASLAGANGLLNRGLYDLAAVEYEKFLAGNPDHEKAAEARYALGVSLYHLGRYADAAQQLAQLQDVPDHLYVAETATVLGQCYLRLGNHEQAAQVLDVVIQRHSEHDLFDDAAALQAETFYLAGAHDRVAAPCRMLVERAPDSPQRERAELVWTLSDMARADYPVATTRLRAMRDRYPRGAHADQTALLLAQCLHQARDLVAAGDLFRQVSGAADERFAADARYGLAAVLYEQGQPQEAAGLLDGLLQTPGTDARTWSARLLRGRIWLDQGMHDQAATAFDELVAGAGRRADEAEYWRAKCEMRRGNAADAAARLGRTIQRHQASALMPEMMYDRAVALTRSDAPDEALEILDAMRKRFPKHSLAVDALQLTAVAQHDLGRWEDSAATCRTFLESKPGHALAPAVAYLAAENAYRAESFDDAAVRYRAYLDTYPNGRQYREATYRLGMALYRMDRRDEAETPLMEVLAGESTAPEFRPGLLAMGDLHFQRGNWGDAQFHLDAYLAAGADQPGADDALLKVGLARHRSGDPDGALAAYQTLIDTLPDSSHRVQAMFERGQALVELDRSDEAASDFEAVVQNAPDSPLAMHALNHLGAIDLGRGEYANAAGRYDRAAKLASGGSANATALLQKGRALMADRSFDPAAKALMLLLDEHGDDPMVTEARARLAICLARLDRHSDALSEITTLGTDRHQLDTGLAGSLAYEEAWCLRSLTRPDEAAVAYRALLALPATGDLHHYARLELAELEADAGRHAEAISLLQPIVDGQVNPAPPNDLVTEAIYRSAVFAFAIEDYPEAATLMERYLADRPGSELAASGALVCGEALLRSGAHQRAAEWLQRVCSEHPHSDACAPALLRLGECHATLQQWDESETAFAEHLKRFPDSDLWFQAQFGLGWAQENQARYDEAAVAYRSVVARHQGPTAARAQFQIGECLFAQGHNRDAVSEFLKVDILYAYPEWTAAALYEAASCFQALGRNSEARDHLNRVITEHPDTRWAQLATQRLEQPTAPLLPGH
ncbi:MAG: tetratricopeptide repeat protein [Planctomycetes bacterium]|nr:tetratricopeptide repeat protein [Planctomycetota bacterium]